MATYHMLYVSFPFTGAATMQAKTREVEKVIGKAMDGAGTGFGMRDVEFVFRTVKELDAAKAKVLAHPLYKQERWETSTSLNHEDA